MRLLASVTYESTSLETHVVMLNAMPKLVSTLQIHTVPVLYFNNVRLEGPVNEWSLLGQLGAF